MLNILLFSILAGCATAPHRFAPSLSVKPTGGIYHTVKAGETLWQISKLYGVDINALLRANSLHDSGVIAKGQVLSIPGVGKTRDDIRSFAPGDTFTWPVNGRVLSPFGSQVNEFKNKGIDIRANEGDKVVASRTGKVVYCDEVFKGFGKTIILDHGDGYETVYAYNSEILVEVGKTARQNDVIARAGKTGRAKEPSLHFEIRKDGKPGNPLYYLPR